MEYVEGEKIKKSYMAKVGYCYGSALTNEKCCSFDTKQKADFTIICRNKSYAVHRALICAHSEFFDGACRNAFRELENGMVDLSEDDPESIDHMIDYFYHWNYLSTKDDIPQVGVPSHVRAVYAATHGQFPSLLDCAKLDLKHVRDPLLATACANESILQSSSSKAAQDSASSSPVISASRELTECLSQSSETDRCTSAGIPMNIVDLMSMSEELDCTNPHLVLHAKVYAIADQYGIAGLKRLAKKKFAVQIEQHRTSREFADCLAVVYHTTPQTDRGLKDIVVSTFRKYPELLRNEGVGNSARVTSELAWDLCMMAMGLPV